MINMLSEERNPQGRLFQRLLRRQVSFVVMTVQHFISDPGRKTSQIIEQNFQSLVSVSLAAANYSRFVDTVTNKLKFMSSN